MKPYYQRADIVLYHADCREVLGMLGAGSVDLIITSPPYNMGNTTGGGLKQYQGHYSDTGGMAARGGSSAWKGCALADGYSDFHDNLPHEDYVAWQKQVLHLCWNKLSDTGAIYYNHKVRILGGIAVTPLEYNPDLPVRQIIIWKRAGGFNHTTAFYLPTTEWIVLFAKPDFRLSRKGAGADGDVWEFSQKANPHHPAPFPTELPARILRTTVGSRVCDPFSGSGTTALACLQMGRSFIGCEISEKYCELAARRIEAELDNGCLFATHEFERPHQPGLLEVR